MSDIQIVTVKNKKDRKAFLKFAWEIYKGDPYWVPPLMMDKMKILDKNKNPFFKNADIELFMALRNGKIVGRIAAIENRMHNKYHKDKVGFFGFFESINDQKVANKLFDAAKAWLKEKGFTEMRGPANPSSNDEYGLLIDGFDDSPRLMMTYNPRYYIDLIDNYGFHKAKDLYAWSIDYYKVSKASKISRVADIATRRTGIKISQIDMKNFKSELERVKYVYNKAWAPNWGFVPMTEEEIDTMAKELKPLVEPSLVLFGEIKGETVGFALVMPDYNFILKQMNGKLFPFGIFKLLTQKRKIKWARIIVLGIIPEYQRKGLDAVFYNEIIHRAFKIGITKGEASWILEDNEMMNRAAKDMKAELYKKYRVYELTIQ